MGACKSKLTIWQQLRTVIASRRSECTSDQRVKERSQSWDADVVRELSESERTIIIMHVDVELGLGMEQN